ncbi:hypothetical protein KJ909_03940 [Patescibacteria group bacterium]|nr:hypothetical protein [Patescibacteria group bacterium]
MKLAECEVGQRARVKRILIPKKDSVNGDWEAVREVLGVAGVIGIVDQADLFPVGVDFRGRQLYRHRLYFKAGELELVGDKGGRR